MPTLVISDIHGKADRLLALLERYPSHELICLGERYILNPGSLGEPLSTSDPTHLLVNEEFAIWQS
tara:strand:- start:89 stop:286 length:198 start_codon:yes stop_codon:yes gene_type:complete